MTTPKQMSANFGLTKALGLTAQWEFLWLFACLFRAFSANSKPASAKKMREIGPEKPLFSQHPITASDGSLISLRLIRQGPRGFSYEGQLKYIFLIRMEWY